MNDNIAAARLLAACRTRELVAACAFGLPDSVPVSDVAAAVLRAADAVDPCAEDLERVTTERDRARETVARYEAEIAAVRALHAQVHEGGVTFCLGCEIRWPCETIRAIVPEELLADQ